MIILSAITITVSSCNLLLTQPDGSEEAKNYGSISGKVSYSDSSDCSDIFVCIEKTDGLKTDGLRAAAVANRSSSSKLNYVQASKTGEYSFTNLEAGNYTVYASSNNSKEKAVYSNVNVRAGEVSLADLKLTATGSVSGKIILDNTAADNQGFIVCLSGTSYMAVTDKDGSFTIDDIPVGNSYNLAVIYGTYTYFVTKTITPKKGENLSLENISLTSENIKENLLRGKDGKDGLDGTDGKDGKDGLNGISIIWLGSFASSDEIEKPEYLNAYFNTTDGCSYIYIEKEWTLLASAGKDGVSPVTEEINYTFDLIDVTGEKIKLSYNKYGDNYQRDLDFTNYTYKRSIKFGDKINIKGQFISDVDIDKLTCLLIDNNGKGDWDSYTKDKEGLVIAENIKAGEAVDVDLVFDILRDQKESFLVIIKTDNTKACQRSPNLTFTRVTDSTTAYYQTEVSGKYVEVKQVENGISFSGTIPNHLTVNNGSVTANAKIVINDETNSIIMRQQWTKPYDSWNRWELTYPFVEKGKTYRFTVTVSNANWDFYSEKFTITAENGLGEFKVENAEEMGTVLDENRIVKRTAEPVFTDNENIKLVNQGSSLTVYGDELWSGTWIYADDFWNRNKNATLPLKDLGRISGWRDYQSIDKMLSGHKYIVYGYTIVRVAGFTYNDTVVFEMNDKSESSGDWGGKLIKVAVIYDILHTPQWLGGDLIDSPGEKIELKFEYDDGSVNLFDAYGVVVNYLDKITEPLNAPHFKDCDSSFNYWATYKNGNRISFPYEVTPSTSDWTDATCSVNGEKVDYFIFFIPSITTRFTATLMDGDEVVRKEIFETKTLEGSRVFIKGFSGLKNGLFFEDWYLDSELTKPFEPENTYVFGDITLYAKWREPLSPDTEAANSNTSKYTLATFTGESSNNYTYSLQAGKTYVVEWQDACSEQKYFSDLTDCYIIYKGLSENSSHRNNDGNFTFTVAESGLYNFWIEGRGNAICKAAFHVYSQN